MHVHFLDPYRPGTSILHGVDARVKLVLAAAFILTTSLSPTGAWPIFLVLYCLLIAVMFLAELAPCYVLLRATLALPFVLAAVPLIFSTPGTPLMALKLGGWSLVATTSGTERFLSIALKSWLSVQAAIVLAATTQFPELLRAMRSIRIPRLLVAMFGLMWRYIFVLVDEALRLLRARAARSGVNPNNHQTRRPGGSLVWRGRVAGNLAGSLFLRGLERSDRIYAAMLARGYNGEVRTFGSAALRMEEKSALVLGVLALSVLVVVGNLIWG